MLRGALGAAFRKTASSPQTYARIFEPASLRPAPSGFADRPRPFVFRTAHLDGKTVEAEQCFWFDVNLFEVPNPPLEDFTRAFKHLAHEGLGPHRVLLELMSVEPTVATGLVSLSLDPPLSATTQVRVEFVTPTELKGAEEISSEPSFGVLFARTRDRISTLRALYGSGPLSIDFRSMGERASAIRLTRSELREVRAERRSGRTGHIHSIGGFSGTADYEGDLDEFIPYLEAARWTGVGRHCVWGNGELRVHRSGVELRSQV